MTRCSSIRTIGVGDVRGASAGQRSTTYPGNVIQTVTWALNLIFIGMAVFALVDSIRRPQQAFPAVDRQTKTTWMALLGVSAAVIFIFGAINLLGILAVVVTMFYFVDVRPRVQEISGSR
jgi:uncharacterized membrane protein YidH (DUF202 family)